MEPSALYRWDLESRAPHATDVTQASDVTSADDATGGVVAPGSPRHTPWGEPAAEAEDVLRGDLAPRRVTSIEDARADVLVHAMRGGMDAGSAGSLVASHLLATHPVTRVATFDVDELMDYRSRRPVMTYAAPRYTDYADPVLALDHVATPDGGLLLLHGPEPDLRWEAFSRAVREIVERLGVTTTVGVHGIPMGVPHTRPVSVTAHATREELIGPQPDMFGVVQIPGSASALLEYRLGEWGHDAVGFAVHVPHYLAQAEYPAAASELVRQVSRLTGHTLDTADLDEAATSVAREVERQVGESGEVAALVQALENQYDAYTEATGRSLLASSDVPTADELGAQFEAFLAQQVEDDERGGEQDPRG